jgi:hypothetical protein
LEVEGMVQQINAGVVSDEDKLSDHVFQYDSESHGFHMIFMRIKKTYNYI